MYLRLFHSMVFISSVWVCFIMCLFKVFMFGVVSFFVILFVSFFWFANLLSQRTVPSKLSKDTSWKVLNMWSMAHGKGNVHNGNRSETLGNAIFAKEFHRATAINLSNLHLGCTFVELHCFGSGIRCELLGSGFLRIPWIIYFNIWIAYGGWINMIGQFRVIS